MIRRQVKVVIDTNWYISATINHKSRRTLYPILANKNINICYSIELIQEYERVIKRPAFSKYISSNQANRFIKLVLPTLIPVKVKSIIQLSRDKKDDFILALAKDANANYIITADFDLLVLKKIGRTRIVSMKDFLSLPIMAK